MAKFGLTLGTLAAFAVIGGVALKMGWARIEQQAKLERETQQRISDLSDDVGRAREALQATQRTTPLVIERSIVSPPANAASARPAVDAVEDPGSAEAARQMEESRVSVAVAETKQKGQQKEAAFFEQGDGGPLGQTFATQIQTAAIHLSGAGRRIGAVECRAQSCRFEADFTSIDEHNAFFDQMFTVENPPVQMGVISVPVVEKSSDGKVHAVFHIARPEISNSPPRAN